MNTEEIDKLKETLREYADYAIKLVKKNKRLQKENEQLKEELKREKEKNNKVIEYCESNLKTIYKYFENANTTDLINILEILKGENDGQN